MKKKFFEVNSNYFFNNFIFSKFFEAFVFNIGFLSSLLFITKISNKTLLNFCCKRKYIIKMKKYFLFQMIRIYMYYFPCQKGFKPIISPNILSWFYLLSCQCPDHQRDKRDITQNSSEDKSIWENLLFHNLGAQNDRMKNKI